MSLDTVPTTQTREKRRTNPGTAGLLQGQRTNRGDRLAVDGRTFYSNLLSVLGNIFSASTVTARAYFHETAEGRSAWPPIRWLVAVPSARHRDDSKGCYRTGVYEQSHGFLDASAPFPTLQLLISRGSLHAPGPEGNAEDICTSIPLRRRTY